MSLPIIPIDPALKRDVPATFDFGKVFANYMFTQKYQAGRGWYDAQIEPYAALSLLPAAAVFHYAQEFFEGAKAYRRDDGNINLFRFMDNCRRFNRSAERLAMPTVDIETHFDALVQLIQFEQAWVPQAPSTLYIRPTMIATSPRLGLATSEEYLHFILLSPVGSYFAKGVKPLSVYVEHEYVRAVRGGVGDIKAGGNYAASVYVSEKVKAQGYDQVLWLDAFEHRYVEEVGAMNIAFVYHGNHIITPALSGSILHGITRDSVLKLAPDLGYTIEEGRLDVEEVMQGIRSGDITEAFGMGTAAVIAPVGRFGYKGQSFVVGQEDQMGSVAKNLLETLTGIQFGRIPDPYNWITTVETH